MLVTASRNMAEYRQATIKSLCIADWEIERVLEGSKKSMPFRRIFIRVIGTVHPVFLFLPWFGMSMNVASGIITVV